VGPGGRAGASPAPARASGARRRPQRLPAGGQDGHAWAAGHQHLGQLGDRVDQVLAVVEDQQHPPGLQQLHQPLHRILLRRQGDRAWPEPTADAQGRGHGVGHRPLAAQRGQLDQPDPVGDVVGQAGRHLHGQAGLARPARTGEGDQPGLFEHGGDPGHLLVPADEAGQRDARVGPRTGRRLGRQVESGVLSEHRRLQPLQLRAGVEAQLLAEEPAGPPVGVQRLGLAARRYRARMSCPRSRSRSGCSATSASSSPTTAAWRPRARSASTRSSTAASRSSVSRVTSPSAKDSWATSARAGPRHSASPSASSAAAARRRAGRRPGRHGLGRRAAGT